MALITKEEKKEVIDHYNRMIKWAEKQEAFACVSDTDMVKAIGECWTSRHCALCSKYLERDDIKDMCEYCPLDETMQKCGLRTSFWCTMHFSVTWYQWLIYANKLRNYVAELPEAK